MQYNKGNIKGDIAHLHSQFKTPSDGFIKILSWKRLYTKTKCVWLHVHISTVFFFFFLAEFNETSIYM